MIDDGARHGGPRGDGRHLRPASAQRARATGSSSSRRWSGGSSCSRRPESRRRSSSVQARADAAAAGGVRGGIPPLDRRRGGRRRRGLPLRAPPGGRPRHCSSGSASTCAWCREVDGRLVVRDPASPARRRRACGRAAARSAVRTGRYSSSRAISAVGRSATRPRTCGSSPTCSCPATGSTPDRARPPGGDLDRHQPALRRHGAADRAVPAGLRGRPLRPRLVVELWERLRDEQVFDSEQALDRPDRPRRRCDACRDPAGLEPLGRI